MVRTIPPGQRTRAPARQLQPAARNAPGFPTTTEVNVTLHSRTPESRSVVASPRRLSLTRCRSRAALVSVEVDDA